MGERSGCRADRTRRPEPVGELKSDPKLMSTDAGRKRARSLGRRLIGEARTFKNTHG
jgi:hypothetical protein